MAKLALILITISTLHIGNCALIKIYNSTCDEQVADSLAYLSTKTPYLYTESNWKYIPEGCTAQKFWYIGRHGTRNPGDQEILYMLNELPALLHEIIRNYDENRGTLCTKEIDRLKSWTPYPGLNVGEEKHLVEQGKKELSGIAERYKARFPDLFPDVFTNETYFFKYTDSQRTEASAHAFTMGLFGEVGGSKVWYPPAEESDPILKFYKNCTKWKHDVDKNPDALVEKTLFESSEYMGEVIINISERLGFLRNLTLKELNMMYITCSFETAWEGAAVISPWCVAFDEQDFSAMNFREDLDYFWVDGYGHEINYEQACPPIKDVVEIFDQLNSTRKVTGYFSHSGANLKVLAHLGLYMDENSLKVSDYEMQREGRQWNTSYMDTMASNMAFVLYSCSNMDEKEQIGYFFQEQPTALKACGDQWICPYEDFKQYFADTISKCDLNEICKLTDENNN